MLKEGKGILYLSCTDPVLILYWAGCFWLDFQMGFQDSFQSAFSPQWSAASEFPPAPV